MISAQRADSVDDLIDLLQGLAVREPVGAPRSQLVLAIPEERAKTSDGSVLPQMWHPETGCPGRSGRIRRRNTG